MKQEQPNCASPEALRLDNQLCFALYSTSLMMTKAYKPLLDKIGLTYPQYLVMLILWQQDGIGLKDISEQLFIDSGALTPVIKRMEVMGLLTRVRPAHNERSLEISLTAQGLAVKNSGCANQSTNWFAVRYCFGRYPAFTPRVAAVTSANPTKITLMQSRLNKSGKDQF
ncbi:MAG: MarR family transcriptional regulator [Rheinheimera sp.]|nr:MarR family transcriptional regulator [Rheinheimera sp.]